MPIGVLVSGVVTGALYALASLAVVIVYKSCKIANFAMGGTGSLAVYLAFSASSVHPPYVILVILAVVAGAVFGVVTDLILRLIGKADHLAYIVGTFAIFLLTQGIILWHWGPEDYGLRAAWAPNSGWRLGGILITYNGALTVALALAVTGSLHLLVQRTRFGLAVRMASSGPLTSSLMGVNGGKVRMVTWTIGGGIGALAAVLATPQIALSASAFTSFMMIAFVALVIGGFTSIPGAAAGGFVLGVILNIVGYWLSPTLTETYLFVIIGILLLLRPHGVFGVQDAAVSEPVLSTARLRKVASTAHLRKVANRLSRPVWAPTSTARRPATLRELERTTRIWTNSGGLLLGAAFLILLPFFAPGTLLNLLPQCAALYLAVLGLNVLAGFSGQLSVGQSGFLAFGAYTSAILSSHLGLPGLVTIPAALVVGLVAGFVVGLPAARLGPLFLVLFTLVLSFAVPEMIMYFGVTGGSNGLAVSFPSWLFDIRNQYWLGLFIAVVCTLAIYALRRIEFGRRWTAVRDSGAGSQSVGINVTIVKLSAFMAAGALASLSGAVSAVDTGFVSPTDYSPFVSITLLVAMVIGGTGSIIGSAIGAALLTAATAYAPDIHVPADLVLGLILLIVLIVSPAGLAELFGRGISGLIRALTRFRVEHGSHDRDLASDPATVEPLERPVPPPTVSAESRETVTASVTQLRPIPSDSPLLEIQHVTAGYGAAMALFGVSISLAEGSATALVGSNGAGKTTLLRVISGLLRPTSGTVTYGELSVGSVSPHALARAGIAHVPEGRGIFPDLTVRENLVSSGFSRSPGEAVDIDHAVSVFPKLSSLMSREAGTLSGGEQQMVAVARALLTKPRLLLLDEPTLGLAPAVAKSLMVSLAAVKELGLTVLLVEQNARAALDFADVAYVMSGGRIVTQGSTDEVLNEDHVLESYLGVKV